MASPAPSANAETHFSADALLQPMGDGPSRAERKDRFVAIIDQDLVTEEVKDIALKYDPLNRSGGREGFHVTEEGELHIEDEAVIEEHSIVANKVPNDAIRIVRLPAERGQLVHQYGENGFRLYELPAPQEGRVVGLLGENGTGKSTALSILGGLLKPNLGAYDDEPDWEEVVQTFRGTAAQRYLEALRDGDVRATYKPQRVDRLAERYEGRVGDLLAERDERDAREEAVDRLDLDELLDRDVDELSGGELQRVAVAATVLVDADTYLIDEPSSYLDVGQRLTVGRALRDLAENRRVVVVEHDLVTLDLLADDVHVSYGEPGGFGVVSHPLSVRRGINAFLAGFLQAENVRIREDAIDFQRRPQRADRSGDVVLSFPELEQRFDGFSLRTESGEIRRGEVLGVLGRNGLGKTTFARLLAGDLDPDAGEVASVATVSYKPQYVQPSFEGSVEALFEREVNVRGPGFDARIRRPFDLDPLFDRDVDELSGGELQRASTALALARDADLYLLDEPSAYLDVDQRASLAGALRRFVERGDEACLVVDHDLLLLHYVADRTMVFEGEPGVQGVGRSPQSVDAGLNRFLARTGVTFRRDPDSGRPRANKPGSRKDREQKAAGDYFAA